MAQAVVDRVRVGERPAGGQARLAHAWCTTTPTPTAMQDVADAEHVRERPRRGHREHVAEECEPGVANGGGVLEAPGLHGATGGSRQGRPAGRHDATVRCDRDEVRAARRARRPTCLGAEVHRDEPERDDVGEQVEDGEQVVGGVGHDRDHDRPGRRRAPITSQEARGSARSSSRLRCPPARGTVSDGERGRGGPGARLIRRPGPAALSPGQTTRVETSLSSRNSGRRCSGIARSVRLAPREQDRRKP